MTDKMLLEDYIKLYKKELDSFELTGDKMISVAIMINGNPICARSAVNKGKLLNSSKHKYLVDDGSIIYHNPNDGAVKLAKLLLDTIKEQD